MRTYSNYIAGRFTGEGPQDVLPVFNPATEEQVDRPRELARYGRGGYRGGYESPAVLGQASGCAARRPSARDRQADPEQIEPTARIISEEQGKPLRLARVEVEFAAEYVDYTAEWARRIEGEIVTGDRPNENIFLFRKPIGVVAGTSREFPFLSDGQEDGTRADYWEHRHHQAQRGDTEQRVRVRPDRGGERIARRCLQRRYRNRCDGGSGTDLGPQDRPDHVHRQRRNRRPHHGRRCSEHYRRQPRAGRKGAGIVLGDANIDLAVEAVKNSRILNSGQICNCAERVYVDRKVADEFTTKLAATMHKTRFGDPLQDDTIDMGPFINRQGYEKVSGLVDSACKEGATVVTGGRRGEARQATTTRPPY